MNLSNLKPAKGSTKARKRIGRGQGSGHGGTSTRGHKGQKSRAGSSVPAWFEGGQMPLTRRLPKYGFHNPARVEYSPVNVSRLAELVESGKIDPATSITPSVLAKLGLFQERDKVKILGNGDLSVALQISAHAFSASAKEKIEAAGGSVTVLD